MKISKKLLAVCVAALTLSMALMGCNSGTSSSGGGSAPAGAAEQKESNKPADDRVDFTWFKASVPEGYDIWSDTGDGGFVGSICFKNVEESDKSISFDVESDDAETLVADETDSDGYTAGEDITIGKYTWKTVNFTWNDTPSVELIAEIPDTGQSVVIYLFMTTLLSRHSSSPSSSPRTSKRHITKPRTSALQSCARKTVSLSTSRESSP